MARPLRIEFPGAIYHVTSRGDRREAIYEDDADRERFLAVLGHAAARFDAQVLAYCLMGNHHHLVLHTRQANLSPLSCAWNAQDASAGLSALRSIRQPGPLALVFSPMQTEVEHWRGSHHLSSLKNRTPH
jgi:REP element-mobilizing transposase RayT